MPKEEEEKSKEDVNEAPIDLLNKKTEQENKHLTTERGMFEVNSTGRYNDFNKETIIKPESKESS